MRGNPNNTPLTDEQRDLAGDPEHVRRALNCAARWRKKWPWLAHDIDSAALLGLVRAARGYDPACGSRFETHLFYCVRSSVLDALRMVPPSGARRDKSGRAPDAPETVPLSLAATRRRDGRPDPYWEPSADEMPVGWELDDGVEELTKILPARHRQAVRAYYTRAGVLMREVGEELGLSESRVSQVITDSLRVLREKFRTEEATV